MLPAPVLALLSQLASFVEKAAFLAGVINFAATRNALSHFTIAAAAELISFCSVWTQPILAATEMLINTKLPDLWNQVVILEGW